MPKFRKKPVEIEAIKWTGHNLKECVEFLGDSYGGHMAERRIDGFSQITVKTLEGKHIASKDDWIIKGVKGEFYPCKPDILNLTYDAIEE